MPREMITTMIMPTTMRDSPASSLNRRTHFRAVEDLTTEDQQLLREMAFPSVMLPLPALEEMERDVLTR